MVKACRRKIELAQDHSQAKLELKKIYDETNENMKELYQVFIKEHKKQCSKCDPVK